MAVKRTDDGKIKSTGCPMCGDPIGRQESLANHLRDDCEENQ